MSFLKYLSNLKLSAKYEGKHSSNVLYANFPATNTHLMANFHDCEVRIKDLKILDSFDGVYEGNPKCISQCLLDEAITNAVNEKAMTVKVIYPQ
jgi:hypothetical protein